jgi:hypothetical protein
MPATFGLAATTAGTAAVMFGLPAIGLITPAHGARGIGATRRIAATTGSPDTGANSQPLDVRVY